MHQADKAESWKGVGSSLISGKEFFPDALTYGTDAQVHIARGGRMSDSTWKSWIFLNYEIFIWRLKDKKLCTRIWKRTHTNAHINTHTHTHIHKHRHTHTHTHTHAHTHTHRTRVHTHTTHACTQIDSLWNLTRCRHLAIFVIIRLFIIDFVDIFIFRHDEMS